MADTDDTAGFMETLNAELYSGGSPVEAVIPDATPTPATKAAKPEVPVAPTAPAVEPTPAAEVEEEVAGRFRLKGPDAVFAQLRKDGVAVDEAHTRAYGPPAKVETPPPADSTPNPLQEKEERLAEVNSRLKAAAADSSFYNDDIDTLQAERAELIADIKISKTDAEKAKALQESQQAQAVAKTEEEAFDTEFAEATELYPDAITPGTELYKVLEAEITARENPTHPRHGTRISPMEFVPSHAARLRIAPAPKAAASTPAPATTPAAKAPGMSPVSGGARTTPPASPVSQPTGDDKIASAKTEDDLKSALAEDLWGAPKAGAAYAF
ncbi:MAG: hypothetical protein WCL08_00305 [Verrucomicrobiota bacterium]